MGDGAGAAGAEATLQVKGQAEHAASWIEKIALTTRPGARKRGGEQLNGNFRTAPDKELKEACAAIGTDIVSTSSGEAEVRG